MFFFNLAFLKSLLEDVVILLILDREDKREGGERQTHTHVRDKH